MEPASGLDRFRPASRYSVTEAEPDTMVTMSNPSRSFDRLETVLAAALVTAAGGIYLNTLPLIVGAVADQFHWDETQLGLYAASGLMGTTLATLTAPFWIRRWRWRMTIRIASVSGMLGWILISQLQTFVPIVLCAFVVGALISVAYAPAFACVSDASDPNRSIGIMIVAQVLVAAAFSMALPLVVSRFALEGVFLALAFASAAPIGLSHFLPDQGRIRIAESKSMENSAGARSRLSGMTFALVGMLLFYTALIGVWGFLELIGNEAQVADEDVALAVAVALVVGLIGAIAAVAMSGRIPQFIAILLGGAGLISSLILLEQAEGFALYLLAAIGMNASWNFSMSYQIGLIAMLDSTGRFTVLVTAMQSIGGFVGPLLAGLVATQRDYGSVMMMGIAATIFSLAAYAMAARFRAKADREDENSKLGEAALEQLTT